MEREILSRVNNPYVVKLFYSFQTRENLYLVHCRYCKQPISQFVVMH